MVGSAQIAPSFVRVLEEKIGGTVTHSYAVFKTIANRSGFAWG